MITFKNIKKNPFRIDITSLIDVVFLIIIFLMLNLGKIHSYLNIDLPKLEDFTSNIEEKIPVISMQKTTSYHYNLFWNKNPTSLIEIENKIKQEKPEKIILKIDKEIPYGLVMEVLHKIQKHQNIKLLLEYELANKKD